MGMGPTAWRNWRASLAADGFGSPQSEAVLYSDASFKGEHLALGPYDVITTGVQNDLMTPALVVRAESLIVDMPRLVDPTTRELIPADSTAYHGGTSLDEIAALISLSCGVRCRAGGTTRVWGLREDPYGSPVYWDMHPVRRPGPSDLEILPLVPARIVTLADEKELLLKFPRIAAGSAVALIRAARLYSNALWWSNEDPNFAWLQLVGAIEVAANRRRARTPKGHEALQALEERDSGLWEALSGAADDVKERVAGYMLPTLRVARKFEEFVTQFQPGPPEVRPSKYGQIEWDEMVSHMRIIYGHRNKALHDGTPFPNPMLRPPDRDDRNNFCELPLGTSASSGSSSWMADQYPLTLQTFEYIVRESLKTWWAALSESA
ncbi:hypothetical protein JOE60_001626 [Paenarthrobacter ilicis]|nr:hypothetical protein [Paenarthrobacter ilicis]MBM7793035.1 hypothetical protein [Paenarthrobacter ilicis]